MELTNREIYKINSKVFSICYPVRCKENRIIRDKYVTNKMDYSFIMPILELIAKENQSSFYFTAPGYLAGVSHWTLEILPDQTNRIQEFGNSMLEVIYKVIRIHFNIENIA